MHLATALRQARAQDAPRDVLASTLQDCMDELRVAVDSLTSTSGTAGFARLPCVFAWHPRFEALGVRLDWKVADNLHELPVLDRPRRCICCALCRRLGNALKHSGASVVTMSLGSTADGTLIQIADNGSGFDPSTVRHGRGMGTLQSRADGSESGTHVAARAVGHDAIPAAAAQSRQAEELPGTQAQSRGLENETGGDGTATPTIIMD